MGCFMSSALIGSVDSESSRRGVALIKREAWSACDGTSTTGRKKASRGKKACWVVWCILVLDRLHRFELDVLHLRHFWHATLCRSITKDSINYGGEQRCLFVHTRKANYFTSFSISPKLRMAEGFTGFHASDSFWRINKVKKESFDVVLPIPSIWEKTRLSRKFVFDACHY